MQNRKLTILTFISTLLILLFLFVVIRSIYRGPEKARMSETIAHLDTIYNHSLHNKGILHAEYYYKVDGQSYYYERKVSHYLPHGLPITIEYYTDNPSHCSAVLGKPLPFCIGDKEYYVTYSRNRISISTSNERTTSFKLFVKY